MDIIPKEPHMLPMVQMEFETAVEAKPMTPESWNVALETFFNPSAHASFKNTMHHFFYFRTHTLLGSEVLYINIQKVVLLLKDNVVKLPLMKSILFYSILAIKWRKSLPNKYRIHFALLFKGLSPVRLFFQFSGPGRFFYFYEMEST